jgi:hypothetical protein
MCMCERDKKLAYTITEVGKSQDLQGDWQVGAPGDLMV